MKQIAVVLGSFHYNKVSEMLNYTRAKASDLSLKIVEEIWVNGSMEKPLAVKKLLLKKNIDGAVVLGIIEKGKTSHGVVMANAVIQSLINLQLEFMKPLGVGILGPGIEPHQINKTRVKNYSENAVEALANLLKN